jgi:hypothetical protein
VGFDPQEFFAEVDKESKTDTWKMSLGFKLRYSIP